MIKDVVFDIGNVLMTFDPKGYFVKWFHTTEKTKWVCNRIFSHEAWEKYDQGVFLLEDLYEVYHKDYPDMIMETDIVLKHWMKLMQPMQTSLAFMKEVKEAGYGVYILSNISEDSANYLKSTQQFFSLADGAVLSYEEHVNKPDPRIYEVLLKRYGLQPENILYLDDCVENIAQAQRMGFHGIVFDREECLDMARNMLKEDTMLKSNQIIRGVICGMDEMHNGILKAGKDIVLVRHVLKQEEVRVKIVKRIAKGYVGEVVEIIQPSLHRTKVHCPIYERCGSCQLMHLDAQGQKEFKNRYIRELCTKEKGMHLQADGIVDMEHPWQYRNKMMIGFHKNRQRKIEAGFYEEFSHTIIPYKRCLLHPSVCDDIVSTIVALMESMRVEPYEEDTRRGLLRHVLIRYGAISKQIMVVLVLNSSMFPARKNFVQELRRRHPEITTIVQNINSRKTSIVLGNEERVLYGLGYIEDELCGMTFRISSKSFYQINHAQTEILYQRAVQLLKLKGNEVVLDAYCGIGTIGMYVSRFVKQVIGVEINRDAVEDAKSNARRNQIANIRFVCEDAGRYMNRLASERRKLDVVIMDPPRSGSSEEFISSLVRLRPRQVLYISCNPKTQMEDLRLFARMGYQVQGNLVPVDMFPHTYHVEVVCLLSKLRAKHNIEVELEMSEMDVTAAESKATFEEIKDYVLEKFGLKVRSLYIAQIKQKCGIIERTNYNLSKSENSRQPKCPPEKEKAIRDALEHFRMI